MQGTATIELSISVKTQINLVHSSAPSNNPINRRLIGDSFSNDFIRRVEGIFDGGGIAGCFLVGMTF